MSIESEYELFSQIELFEDLDPIQLKRLIFVSQRYQLNAGEYLIRQGDMDGNVFGVLEGELDVLLESPNGEVNIAQHGHGELVGEMSVISGEPRNASVRASSPCEVIGFERDNFIKTVTCCPNTALKMMRILTTRLAKQNQQLVALSKKQIDS